MPIIEETHTATVTAIDDPKQRLRIRCSCVGLLGGEDGELPMWVEPELQWGWVVVPDVGEIVEIVMTVSGDTDDSFAQTSLENPDIRWRGIRHWSDDQDGDQPRPVPDAFKINYGKRRGFATPAGHVFVFDDTPGAEKIILTHAKGAEIEIDAAGLVHIKATTYKIGTNATEAAVLGDVLNTNLGALTVPTGMGPSGTPLNATSFPGHLSTIGKVK